MKRKTDLILTQLGHGLVQTFIVVVLPEMNYHKKEKKEESEEEEEEEEEEKERKKRKK